MSLSELLQCFNRDRESNHYERGLFTGGLIIKSLNSLESLQDGRILLRFPQPGCSLVSESLNSLESLENGLF